MEPEQRNKKILDGVRAIAFRDLNDILKDLPRDLVKGALSGEHFAEYFFPACKDEKLTATVKEPLRQLRADTESAPAAVNATLCRGDQGSPADCAVRKPHGRAPHPFLTSSVIIPHVPAISVGTYFFAK